MQRHSAILRGGTQPFFEKEYVHTILFFRLTMEGGERWGWWCVGEGGKDEGGGEGWKEVLTFGGEWVEE
jgi:hypothetical protein